jgi:hypothetical protein
MALPCAVQKLLCADAAAPAYPRMLGRHRWWKTSSRCSYDGVISQD